MIVPLVVIYLFGLPGIHSLVDHCAESVICFNPGFAQDITKCDVVSGWDIKVNENWKLSANKDHFYNTRAGVMYLDIIPKEEGNVQGMKRQNPSVKVLKTVHLKGQRHESKVDIISGQFPWLMNHKLFDGVVLVVDQLIPESLDRDIRIFRKLYENDVQVKHIFVKLSIADSLQRDLMEKCQEIGHISGIILDAESRELKNLVDKKATLSMINFKASSFSLRKIIDTWTEYNSTRLYPYIEVNPLMCEHDDENKGSYFCSLISFNEMCEAKLYEDPSWFSWRRSKPKQSLIKPENIYKLKVEENIYYYESIASLTLRMKTLANAFGALSFSLWGVYDWNQSCENFSNLIKSAKC